MSSSRKRFVVRHPVVVDIGCSCRRPKLPSFITNSFPKPKSSRKLRSSPVFSSTTSATTRTATSTTSSSFYDTASPSLGFSAPESPIAKPRERKKKNNKKGTNNDDDDNGVAVVKESSNPYVDFKDSMLQMIFEMDIYEWDDLRELLHRFLVLNSPNHHQYILRAFAEIWTEVFSPNSTSTRNY